MDVRMDELLANVEPEAAIAWWTDFQDGHHDHGFLPRVRREVLSRDGDAAHMRDRARVLGVDVFSEEVRAWREGHLVRFEGKNNVSTFEGSYAFEVADGGTRIRLDARVRLRGALRLTEPIARPIAMAVLRRDLRGHVEQMARELR